MAQVSERRRKPLVGALRRRVGSLSPARGLNVTAWAFVLAELIIAWSLYAHFLAAGFGHFHHLLAIHPEDGESTYSEHFILAVLIKS